MILAINYASERFRPAQKLNTKSAIKYGADKVKEYSEKDISAEFKEENKEIFTAARGDGYWLWKPYIIKDALSKLNDGDYLIYTDSGTTFIRPISLLIDAMNQEGTDVMCFCTDQPEYRWSKADAMILMECTDEKYLYSNQIAATYLILKKSRFTGLLLDEYLAFASNSRIVTDAPSILGKEHPEFRENRYDQTVWSLLCKKHGIKPFLEPTSAAAGPKRLFFSDDINQRSPYPPVIEAHKKCYIQYYFQLNMWKLLANYYPKAWKYFSRVFCTAFRIPYTKNTSGYNYKKFLQK